MADKITVELTEKGTGEPIVTIKSHGPKQELDTLRIDMDGMLWTKRNTKRPRRIHWNEMDKRLWRKTKIRKLSSPRANRMQLTVWESEKAMPTLQVKAFQKESVIGTMKVDAEEIQWIPYNMKKGVGFKWTDFDEVVTKTK